MRGFALPFTIVLCAATGPRRAAFFAATTASNTSRLGTPASAATAAMASLRRSPASSRTCTLRTSSAASRSAASVRGALDDDGDLAAHPVGRPGGQLAQRAAPDLLVRLGQLPADRGPALGAEDLGHRGEGVVEPVRGLEVDEGAALAGDLAQPGQPLARLARQEALEAEPVDGQPGQRERGEHGGRARARR